MQQALPMCHADVYHLLSQVKLKYLRLGQVFKSLIIFHIPNKTRFVSQGNSSIEGYLYYALRWTCL
jgi:hypothetical protein